MKFLKILLALVILAGAAVAVIYFFFPEQEIPLLTRPYPKEAAFLREQVGIEATDNGCIIIDANQRSDLFYMQGFHHGKRHGKQLDQLRRMFLGERVPQLPADLRNLAELFYYLDLRHTAEKCLPLYSGQISTILTAYARGLDEGAGEEISWTVLDTLLLQRGYAFLMGRNLIKEWSAHRLLEQFQLDRYQAVTDYPSEDFGALSLGLQLNSSLDGLMALPPMETVRLFNGRSLIGTEVRVHPYLTFAFEPMILHLSGVYEAQGLALAGLPFLWSGSTGNITFSRQPVLADDEQFFSAPSFSGSSDTFQQNKDAAYAADYPDLPTHSQLGRRVNALVRGNSELDIYYFWQGFRPSADLSSLYYLLEADGIDQAISAYQYHQVPATELTLVTEGGHAVNLLASPSDPREVLTPGELFTGPYTRIGIPLKRVRGIHFSSETPWSLKRLGKIEDSELDQELIALVRFFLQGPVTEEQINLVTQEAMLQALADDTSPARDYFVHSIWHHFLQLLQEEYMASESRPAIQALSMEARRLVLDLYGRAGRSGRDIADEANRTRAVADLLLASWRHFERESKGGLTYLVPRGVKLVEKDLNWKSPSPDSPSALFFHDDWNQISQVTTYTLMWGSGFQYWQFGMANDNSFELPKLVQNPTVSDAMLTVLPKL